VGWELGAKVKPNAKFCNEKRRDYDSREGTIFHLEKATTVENDDADEWNKHEDREDGLETGLLEDHPIGNEDHGADGEENEADDDEVPGLEQVSMVVSRLVDFQPAMVARQGFERCDCVEVSA